MKYTFLVLVVLFFGKLYGQDTTAIVAYYESKPGLKKMEEISRKYAREYPYRDSCLKGLYKAAVDFENGVYKIGGFGYPSPMGPMKASRFKVFGEILWDDYSIKRTHYGCNIETVKECYTGYMEEKIKEKYGDNIYERVWAKVDSLWALDLVDVDAYFPGGDEAMYRFIICNMNLLEENEGVEGVGKYFSVELFINDKGGITSHKIKKDKEEVDLRYFKEIDRLVSIMPDWMPAIENQKKIASNRTIRIGFDWRSKEILKSLGKDGCN